MVKKIVDVRHVDLVADAATNKSLAGGQRWNVPADFVVQGEQIGFALGEYDRSRPLVIDPVLGYSTYLGGSGTDVGLLRHLRELMAMQSACHLPDRELLS